MKKLMLLLALLIATIQQAQPQAGISGNWRVAGVVPDGTPDAAVREFNMELKTNGTSITATVKGAPIDIREGRIEGNTVTLSGINPENNQPVSLTGNLRVTKSCSMSSDCFRRPTTPLHGELRRFRNRRVFRMLR